ncbi:MAG: hypothetical protein ACR2IE_03165 [Candidatus Sumerlaeaceae bacterium]
MSEHHAMPVAPRTLPAAPPIECVAEALERPRITAAQAGSWVFAGFLLVLCLKVVGILIVAMWLLRRFPRMVFAAAAAIPIWSMARRGSVGSRRADEVRSSAD